MEAYWNLGDTLPLIDLGNFDSHLTNSSIVNKYQSFFRPLVYVFPGLTFLRVAISIGQFHEATVEVKGRSIVRGRGLEAVLLSNAGRLEITCNIKF